MGVKKSMKKTPCLVYPPGSGLPDICGQAIFEEAVKSAPSVMIKKNRHQMFPPLVKEHKPNMNKQSLFTDDMFRHSKKRLKAFDHLFKNSFPLPKANFVSFTTFGINQHNPSSNFKHNSNQHLKPEAAYKQTHSDRAVIKYEWESGQRLKQYVSSPSRRPSRLEPLREPTTPTCLSKINIQGVTTTQSSSKTFDDRSIPTEELCSSIHPNDLATLNVIRPQSVYMPSFDWIESDSDSETKVDEPIKRPVTPSKMPRPSRLNSTPLDNHLSRENIGLLDNDSRQNSMSYLQPTKSTKSKRIQEWLEEQPDEEQKAEHTTGAGSGDKPLLTAINIEFF